MTKINITAIIFATLISGATQSLSAQSGVRPTPIDNGSILGQLEGHIHAAPSEIADPILAPIESDIGDATSAASDEIAPTLSEQPLNQGSETNYFDEQQFNQSVPADNGNGFGLRSYFDSSSGTNRVWGISGVGVSREDFNDSVVFTDNIDSGNATQDLGGLDLSVATRNGGGRGWEFRYLGLFEDDTSEEFIPPVGSAIFPVGGSGVETLTRTSDLHNIELNLLRQRRNQILWTYFDTHESLIGFRYFRFNETLDFQTNAGTIAATQNRVEVENSLLGIQTGRRLEKRLFGNVSVFGSGKFGVFNNRAENNNFSTSPSAFAAASETKDDIAFVGELDLGGIYAFNQRVRAKLGYRAIVATGVAIGEGQFNQDLTTSVTVNTAGDLFFRGGYFGFEFVY